MGRRSRGSVPTMSGSVDADPLRVRLRRALPLAMKARDQAAVTALRSALAAIENAEAVAPSGPPGQSSGVIAGAATGLGAGEAARRELSEQQIFGIVQAEVTDRRTTAGAYERAGQVHEAARLRAEADVLAAHLDGERQ